MKPREKDIQRAILDYLRLFRIFCWKQNNVGIQKANGAYIPSTVRGIPDILGIMPDGVMLAIEVKVPGNPATHEQAEFLHAINFNGGIAFVANSVDDVIKKVPPKYRLTA